MDTIDYSGDATAPSADAASVYQWVRAAGQRVDAGLPLDQSGQWDPAHGKFGMPPGYDIENGHLSQNAGNLRAGLRGAAGVGLGVLGGYGAGYLNDMVNGASSVAGGAADLGDAAGLADVANAAPAASGAGGGAGGGVTALSTDLLPSTATVPNTGALVPATTSSLSGGASAVTSLPNWLKAAQGVGDALSAASAGRAEGRMAEGVANQNQNRTAVNLYDAELAAPSQIARNAVRGDVLANAQDVHLSAPSTIPDFTVSGGLRPSMFSDATRQTGRNISTAAANTPVPSPTAPVLPDLPQAGGLDHFLNAASSISGISRAIPPAWWGPIGQGVKGLFA